MESSPDKSEERIHALLCGDLDEVQRDDVLSQIARDEAARRLLERLLRLQNLSRQAFGYDEAHPIMRAGLADVQHLVREGPPAPLPSHKATTGRLRRSVPRWARPIAAALALGAAACLGFVVSRTYLPKPNQRADEPETQIADMRAVRRDQVETTPEELARYGRIWAEVAGPGDAGRPWILIQDGAGRFEYLPADSPEPQGAVLVRCVIVGPDGMALERLNVVLPARPEIHLALGETGRLDGLPVECSVFKGDGRLSLDVKVDRGGGAAVGVRGTVSLGQGPTEVGRFTLNGQSLRVFLQASKLNGRIS